MDFLNELLRIGIIIAIFRFIWFFIQLLMWVLAQGKIGLVQHYVMRGAKYVLLGQILPLFCLDGQSSLQLRGDTMILTGLIFILYMIGKLQQNQQKSVRFQFINGMQNQITPYRFSWEIGIVVLGIASIVFFGFYPEYSQNKISFWFYEQILSLEDAAIIGWIFKLVGFFFVVVIFQQFVQSLRMIFHGRPEATIFQGPNDNQSTSNPSDEEFDDYEEIK